MQQQSSHLPGQSDVSRSAPNKVNLDQWVSEVQLFMDETTRELQEIAKLLNMALSTGQHEFENAGATVLAPVLPLSGSASLGSSDDNPLANLQHRISDRLRQARRNPPASASESAKSPPQPQQTPDRAATPDAYDSADDY